MTEQERATELKVGETYIFAGETYITLTQVMGPDITGRWRCLDHRGECWEFPREKMPYVAAPEPTQPAPRFEWRKVRYGDQFVWGDGHGVGVAVLSNQVGKYRWVFVPVEATDARP